MNPFPYKRVVVIGTTSSGKSTLAKQLADLFALEFIELDALFGNRTGRKQKPRYFENVLIVQFKRKVGWRLEITAKYATFSGAAPMP
ncbi:MAG: hypothetical protein IPJ47_01655 [Anaerolineales bacterium]|nr:hypothetical protein [Anaerolineales bacterium]